VDGIPLGCLCETERGAKQDAAQEANDVGQEQILPETQCREEVEVHERPYSSPVINGRNETKRSNKVVCYSLAADSVLLHGFLLGQVGDSHNNKHQEVRDDDTVPSLDILDRDLAWEEDVSVLQLPQPPPAADDQCVHDAVGEQGVKDQFVAVISFELCTKVVARIKNASKCICCNVHRNSPCAMEGLEDNKDDSANEKGGSKADPIEARECIQNIETSNPHDNTKESIKVENNECSQSLNTCSFIYENIS